MTTDRLPGVPLKANGSISRPGSAENSDAAFLSMVAIVGGGVSDGYSWGTSNAVTYGGRLGDIGTPNFSGNLYTTGIFSYIYRYGNTSEQQFEVVNFWVQRQAQN